VVGSRQPKEGSETVAVGELETGGVVGQAVQSAGAPAP